MRASGSDKKKKLTGRKQLRTTDPRKTPGGAKNAQAKTGGVDWVVIVLLAAAALLLVFVILMFGDASSKRFFASGAGRAPVQDSAPLIERTEGAPQRIEEPIAVIEAPEEAVVQEADPVPDEAVENQGDASARLFFIKVSGEGTISTKSVLRQVQATGSPLTIALNALLKGPAPGEISADVLSLIPENSILLGARVEGGTAFLDFNEAFRFNALGLEGYRAQVEQVVYTATEFPTVDKVQFLIEGQRIDFLGGEGFWIGAPLGRDDF